MKKIIDVNLDGKHYVGYYDEKANYNKYKLYERWGSWGKSGRWTEHKTLMAKYADVTDVLYHIAKCSVVKMALYNPK